MASPLIGISMSHVETPHHQDVLNTSYSRAIRMAGGIPIPLPNDAPTPDRLLDLLAGVLLSGGADLSPVRYGEECVNETVVIDAPRDETEMDLIPRVLKRDLPVIAICRGIQSLNVALGGTLWQDLPSQRPDGLRHRQGEARGVTTHTVAITQGTRLANWVGGGVLDVNTFHHQAINRLADGLVPVATAPDGIIEAVDYPPARFLAAVQWHPEELVTLPRHSALFAAFVDACRTQPRS